ncbi:MAG TPA: hypothetical protein VNV42_14580 [Solirubrobacteraceae bacterium]|nr:hypothetical protein [Solirubrobacteraceae bacterium]
MLALVVQQPDTVGNLAIRLSRQFQHAQFSRNAVHNNLPSLVEKGLVRQVVGGAGTSRDRFEATPEGAAYCRAWVREPAKGPRWCDGLRGRLLFSSREDLDVLIRAASAEEELCAREYGMAHAGEMRARTSRVSLDDADYETKIECALIADEAAFWAALGKRRQRLRERLEEIRDASRA